MIKPFTPDGVVPFPGILLCIAASSVAAVASGYALGYVSYLGFSLLIIWPLLMGLGAGGGTLMGIRHGAVRNVALGWVVAGLAGVLSVAASHHINYLVVKHEVVAETTQQAGEDGEQVSPEEAEAFFDETLQEKTGSAGFVGFVKMEASQGTSISRRGSKTQIGEDGTYMLWAVEAFMALAVSIAVARKQASQPYCARCNAWYQAAAVGVLDVSRLDEIKRMFETSSLARLVDTAHKALGAHQPHALLTLQECGHCTQAEPVMTLEKVTYDGKNRESKKAAGAWFVSRVQAHETMAAVKAP